MAKYLLVLLSYVLCFSAAQNSSFSSLLEALEFVTADSSYVFFTDWEQLKAYEGVTELSGQDSFEERKEFYQSLSEKQAAASAHGVRIAFAHDLSEVWGWDVVDLRWEMTLQLDRPPVYVLALQKDFELEKIEELLEERNYQKSSYEAADFYSHELELGADWVLGELSIFNIAVLRDKKILVLSSSPDSVREVLAAYRQEFSLKRDLYNRTLNPLGEVASAILTLGTGCSELSFETIRRTLLEQGMSQEAIEKMQEQIGSPLFHPYVSFALGYRYENNEPLGIVVMNYADVATAEADLEARRLVAEEGVSLRVNQSYREAVFELQEAYVEDTAIVLELLPVNNQPRRLFEMVYSRDMTFAGCP